MTTLIGTTRRDTLTGGDGDDFLSGLDGDDVLIGGAGDDTLVAGEGNDTLRGGEGNDTYVFGRLDNRNRIFEDGGRDTIMFGEDVTVWDVIFLPDGIDLNVSVVDLDAELDFSSTRISINTSGGGVERFLLADGTELTPGIVVEGENIASLLTGTDGSDQIIGGSRSDTLDGGEGNDRLVGGSGADLMRGGAGQDVLFVQTTGDTVLGGAGLDTAVIRSSSALDFDLADAAGAVASFGTFSMGGIERINQFNTRFADNVTGGALGDILRGGGGLDTLNGAGGDDLIIDSRDGAVITGGGGDDTIQYNQTVDIDGGNGADLIVAFTESTQAGGTIRGGGGNDTIGGLDDRLALGSIYDGGTGVDVLRVDQDAFDITDGPFTLNLSGLSGGGEITTTSGAVLRGFEAVELTLSESGTVFDVTTTSGSDSVSIIQFGAHRVDGGAGDDTLSFQSSGDVTVLGGAGDDAISFSRFAGGQHTIRGGSGDDTVSLNLSVDRSSVIDGGAGFDTLIFDPNFASQFNSFEAIFEAYDITGFESFDFGRLTSRAGEIVGTEFADAFDGTDGDDTLIGLDGSDFLDGGAGDDVLYGDGGPG